MFKYQPSHPQPCKQIQIFGWMSVAHWNGSVFRVGEEGEDGLFADAEADDELNDGVNELIEAAAQEKIDAAIEVEFRQMVQDVESTCMPRMAEREELIKQKKMERFKRVAEVARVKLLSLIE